MFSLCIPIFVIHGTELIRATHKKATLHNSTRLGTTVFNKTLKNAYRSTTEYFKLQEFKLL